MFSVRLQCIETLAPTVYRQGERFEVEFMCLRYKSVGRRMSVAFKMRQAAENMEM